MMRPIFLAGLVIICLIVGCMRNDEVDDQGAPPYQPTWESLSAYEAASPWFRDAKFGIYLHWGVLSLPAFAND